MFYIEKKSKLGIADITTRRPGESHDPTGHPFLKIADVAMVTIIYIYRYFEITEKKGTAFNNNNYYYQHSIT